MRETVAARPTMISAKYRLKEERRRILKLSVNKLRRIEDPESSLRRSVLINNTVRRLQREQREARNPPPAPVDDVFAETDVTMTPLREEEPVVSTAAAVVAEPTPSPNMVLEELEDVLSQFYMPPTPRMITSIDEDEARAQGRDADEEDGGPAAKRPRGGSSPSCPLASKRPALDHRLSDAADDEAREARALADPTNTLDDFKDEVYLRPATSLASSAKPRMPLASAACANVEDALRADFCGRRFTHTGHDRENIAPLGLGLGFGTDLGLGMGHGLGPQGLAAASAAGPGASVPHAVHNLQPYSCSQAHGQAQATQHGLVFHGLMATMES